MHAPSTSNEFGKTSNQERAEMILRMREISRLFYAKATGSGVHAFIEFCGLMNEFITVCEQAEAQGIPFEEANTHSGVTLPFHPHNASYLAEKLNCIYGPSFLERRENREAFIAVLFGGEYQLVSTKGQKKAARSKALP